MGPYEKHIFICTSGKVCPVAGGSAAVHARLKELVTNAGLDSTIRVNHAGCMSQCGNGPMVVIYPENVWYCGVTAEDTGTIFSEHIRDGRPVERLIYHPLRPGANKKT
jgi:(2Fe-2S) ferredoxin